MSVLSDITSMPRIKKYAAPAEPPAPDPALVTRSAFVEDTEPAPTMQDIAALFAAKRDEQRAKLKRLAAITSEFARLHQEQADILNSFDA